MTDPFAGNRPAPLVHVGYPKALSSWMQKHLFQPAQGYATALNPLDAKLNIIATPPFSYDKAAALGVADENLRKHGTELVPVVTSESLVGNPAIGGADAELLARRLYDIAPNATVLLVVREQRAMIRSLYKTLVGFLGFPHSVQRLLQPRDRFAMPQFSTDFLQYHHAVDMYARLWGPDNVVVLPYELFADDPTVFVAAIAEKTGAVSTAPLPTGTVVNAGSRLLDIQRERARNVVFEGGPFNYLGLREPTNERMAARLKRINEDRSDNALNRRIEQRFKDQVDELTAGVFAEGNAALAALIGRPLGPWGYEL